MTKRALIPTTDTVESRILSIRGQKVILNSDLASIYGVPVKRLNEQIKRNPNDFQQIFFFSLHLKSL
jgi:hypothetical protein